MTLQVGSTMTLQVVSFIRSSKSKQDGTENNRSWLSTDQTMAPEDSAWQTMPHVCEIGCIL